MVNFVREILSGELWRYSAGSAAEEARLNIFHRASKAAVEAGLSAWEAANPRPVVPLAAVADNIEHVVKVAGDDHVGTLRRAEAVGESMKDEPAALSEVDTAK